MGVIVNLIFSLMAGMSCNAFFGAVLSRKRRLKDLPFPDIVTEGMQFLAFVVVFLVIAYTEAPGYLFQPLRVIVFLSVIILLFFRARVRETLLLALLWCALYWVLNLLAVSAAYILPGRHAGIQELSDLLCVGVMLGLSLVFRYKYDGLREGFERADRGLLAWSATGNILLAVVVTVWIWNGDSGNKGEIFAIAAGYAGMNVLILYFIGHIMKKESEIQKAYLMQEKLQNQLELYQNMQENDIRRRRYLHDYKNQLGCIQGMLEAGRMQEALVYIKELNGSIRKGEDHVDTKHLVVNTVLNQKYLYAQERGITMVMAVNDLSSLSMSREDIVTLLVNLLDNAIEACEKLDENKIIRFKMILEEGGLTVSVRNPVREPVVVKGKVIATTKGEKDRHGLGFLNIQSVIEKNQGTSVMECRDGWFCFSAMISGV
ncbi:MAG: GHKL domain-containing protein [Dorea sp.]|jgi:two-component system sensor histidine kinase AgrC|nr:GHKL domain-containing protein [Dorea sp.]